MKADCHIHMVLDGKDWRAAIARHRDFCDDAFIMRTLRAYADAGYTYLRDGGDRWGVGARAAKLAPTYGICYRTPLAPLCKRGHYGAFIGEKYENLREYALLVRKARENGADFIKVMISGLMDFDRFGVLSEEGLTEAEIRELIHIAHEEGLPVMAHANGARTVQAAAQAKVDSVEHGAYLDEDALEALREYRVIWTPTLSTIANLRGTGRFCEESVEAIFENATQNVRRFSEMGGLIAEGSDAGAWAVPHALQSEFPLLLRALGDNARSIVERGNRAVIDRF